MNITELQKMLDSGFAMLDIDAEAMAEFMQARSEDYLNDAREAGLIQ